MICSIIFGALASQQASAQSFGVSFVGNGNVNVTGTAGVVPIANWNNISGATFATGTIQSSDLSSTANLTVTGAAAAGSWNSGSATDGGNGSLMNGYVDAGANNGGGVSVVSTISGLTGSFYDVYVYIYSDASHPGNDGDWLPNYTINGAPVFVAQLGNGTTTYNATSTPVGGAFTGFIPATIYGSNFNSQTLNASDFGNYFLVSSVMAVGGVITITSEASNQSWRSPLNGFEIVQGVPEPSTVALSIGGLAMLGFIRRRNK